MEKQKQDDYRYVNKVDRTCGKNFNASSNNYKYGGSTRNRNYNQGRQWSFSNHFSHYSSQRGTKFDKYGAQSRKNRTWRNRRYNSDYESKKKPAPVEGTEEYTQNKIKETSASIMRQLLSPGEDISTEMEKKDSDKNVVEAPKPVKEALTNKKPVESRKRTRSDDKNSHGPSTNFPKVPRAECSVDEMRSRIMSHICNLNDGRRKNLINATNSGFDAVIQDFNKQKRLEISRALRDICLDTSEYRESSDLINSIIPDMGVKIEEMPKEFVEELSKTVELSILDDFGSVEHVSNDCLIKEEVIDEEVAFLPTEVDQIRNDLDKALSDFFEHAMAKNSDSISKDAVPSEELVDPVPLVTIDESACDKEASEVADEPTDEDEEEEDKPVNDSEVEVVQDSIPESVFKLEDSTVDATDSNSDVEKATVDKVPDLMEQIPRNDPENVENIQCNCKCTPADVDETFIKKLVGEPSENLNESVKQMFRIDEIVSKLTFYRQNLFLKLVGEGAIRDISDKNEIPTNKPTTVNEDKSADNDQQKKDNGTKVVDMKSSNLKADASETDVDHSYAMRFPVSERRLLIETEATEHVKVTETLANLSTDETSDSNGICLTLNFPQIQEKILVLKVLENELLAATESGKIYVYDMKPFKRSRVIDITNLPITSLVLDKEDPGTTNVYIGSIEDALIVYDYFGAKISKRIKLIDCITCMEQNWGFLFLGTKMGHILRYSIKKQEVEFEDKVPCNVIQVIKPTLEGARRVLIVGSSDSVLCVKDAMTGLLLRQFTPPIGTFAVRCLTLLNSYMYCGTNMDAYMFYFNNGNLRYILRHASSHARGINCMEIQGSLLFLGCENGSVYVYKAPDNKFVGTMKGPGGSILSMKVLDNQVIVGTKLMRLSCLLIPRKIRKVAEGKWIRQLPNL